MLNSVRARCRIIPDFNVAAVVCLAMALLFAGIAIGQPPRGFDGWSAFAAMIALWSATPFYWLVARRRGCIEFDENGARWRTAFGMGESARWDEIESCDACPSATGGKTAQWKFIVQTRRGAFSWTDSFEKADQLAPFAAGFCPLIPPKTDDWPRRFGYGGGESVVLPLAILFLLFMLAGAIAKWLIGADWNSLAAQFAVYVELYGWPLTVAGFAVFGVLIVGLPLLFLLFSMLAASQGWRHRGETFVATTDGLSWRVGGRERFFAAWDELQTLHSEARGRFVALPHFRLQCARGEFNWNRGLGGADQLSRTCFERAPQLQHEVQARLREELNDTPDEQGAVLTFDFKTRSARAILWICAVASASGWANCIWGPFQPPKGGEPAPTWLVFIISVLATAATSYGIQIFRRGCIVLDARGIRWDLPFRKQFVAWDEISELIIERRLYLQVGARRVPLGTHDIYPTRSELLLETIARRAVHAGGEWKRVDTKARARDAK